MSCTNEMAEMLIHWYANLPEGNIRFPHYREEALRAITDLSAFDAIHRIAKNAPEAFQLIVGHPNYLTIDPGWEGCYAVSEMRYRSDIPGGPFERMNIVGVNNAFEAMINLKQRYDWEMSSAH